MQKMPLFKYAKLFKYILIPGLHRWLTVDWFCSRFLPVKGEFLVLALDGIPLEELWISKECDLDLLDMKRGNFGCELMLQKKHDLTYLTSQCRNGRFALPWSFSTYAFGKEVPKQSHTAKISHYK